MLRGARSLRFGGHDTSRNTAQVGRGTGSPPVHIGYVLSLSAGLGARNPRACRTVAVLLSPHGLGVHFARRRSDGRGAGVFLLRALAHAQYLAGGCRALSASPPLQELAARGNGRSRGVFPRRRLATGGCRLPRSAQSLVWCLPRRRLGDLAAGQSSAARFGIHEGVKGVTRHKLRDHGGWVSIFSTRR